ncbi:MAG: hypothetical protein ABI907_10065 [Ramlibacter sp.]
MTADIANAFGRLVCALLALTVAGCNTMLVAETIPQRAPDLVATRVELVNANFGPCDIGLDRSVLSGDSIPRPVDDEVLAGFNNTVLRGADPFPCNRQRSQVYTGAVHFNLDDVRGTVIDSAVLRVQRRGTGIGWRVGGSSRECLLAVARATQGWVPGYASGGAGTTISGVAFQRGLGNRIVGGTSFDEGVSSFGLNVTDIVQQWVLGRSNFGFMVHQEEPDGSAGGANDRSCTSVLRMTLEMSIRRFVPAEP